MIVRKNKPT
ncbi:Protein of unknown function [Bacillus thuringiensis]|uniref:Uncharacterized protein n=1 Tax=Bacillus thuringiensis TaxID=1428 RepID=A0A1C4F8J9_BACTU|nr:Protein of unknown function [Bacillus thuringiensis]